MTTTSIATTNVYNAISESIYDELLTNKSIFYTYISRTYNFVGNEGVSTNSQEYVNVVRNHIVYMKRINVNDISFVVKRIDWASGNVYDMYDDTYHGAIVENVSIITGGSGYDANTFAYVVDGGGRNAILSVVVTAGEVTKITVENAGIEFTSVPVITIIGIGTGASAVASITSSYTTYSGNSSLRKSNFYVMNPYYDVYKCLDNKNNSVSTSIPDKTIVEPFTTSDGYVWKFMYHIPLVLRKKFLTTKLMPVTNVLTSSFYSNGGINYVSVIDGGSGYTATGSGELSVVGDGSGAILHANISKISGEIASVDITNSGNKYFATTTKLIYSIQQANTVITVTTNVNHKLIAGTSITLTNCGIYNGTYAVVSVTNNKTFVITLIGGSGSLTTTYGTVKATTLPSTISIQSVSVVDNVAVITTTAAHYYNEGNAIAVSGVSGITLFDGNYQIETIISPTSFSVVFVGANIATGAVGSITLAPISVNNIVRTSNVVTLTTLNSHNFFAPKTITAISVTTNVVTVTSANHGILVGSTVIIAGTTNFNGVSAAISAVTTNTFQYSKVSAAAAEATGTASCSIDVADITGFTGSNYSVVSVVDSKNITFAQVAANYSSYAPQQLVYNTGLKIAGTGNGKYVGNLTALIYPNILKKQGFGYSSAPLIAIRGATGTGATATASLTSTYVSNIVMGSLGSGYTTMPVVYFNGGTTNMAAATVSVSGGLVSNIVTISGVGKGYYAAPLILLLGGGGTGATAVATIAAGQISTITITSQGTGYTSAPTVYFSGTSDLCCSGTVSLYNGTVENISIDSVIDAVNIVDPGVDYVPETSVVITINGDGIGAVLTPYIKNGVIAGVTVDSAGEGYSYADLTFSSGSATAIATFNTTTANGQLDTLQYNNEILAIDGGIHAIKVISGGTGYLTGDVVTVSGDGSSATGIVTASGGVITSIAISNYGTGYRKAKASVSSVSGADAVLRPIIAPYGGHGKNAIRELFADNIMFYSKLSNADSYLGYGINSQFYQYGLFRSPNQYGTTKMVTNQLVSTGFDVNGTFIAGNFPLNDMVKITNNGIDQLYRIVDTKTNCILLQPDEINSYVPVVGDLVVNVGNAVSFNITSINLPTVNKYSGTIIDINNATAFNKDAQQIIALRTLISI